MVSFSYRVLQIAYNVLQIAEGGEIEALNLI